MENIEILQKVCCIIDVEGFYVPTQTSEKYEFMVREVAYVKINPYSLYAPKNWLFDIKKHDYPICDAIARRAIKRQEEMCNGLSFRSTENEKMARVLRNYDKHINYLQRLPDECCIYYVPPEPYDIIAYYDDPDVHKLLEVAKIPNLSLKSYNCPGYASLLLENSSYSEVTCGFHKSTRTCPMARVQAFRDWWMHHF